MTDVPIKQGIDLERWNELGWQERHTHIAYQRALDTMQAWEMLGKKGRTEAIMTWRARKERDAKRRTRESRR
jgi:hypothetical protein